MKGKPGTRARIPPRSKAIIMTRAVETPRTSRKELAKRLQNELEEEGFDVPEIEVLERMISKYRNEIHDGPEDKPWSLLTLTDCDIAAEALPTVFDLWAYALREYQKPLTIREVKWAARLYRIMQDDLEGLLLSSIQYAAYEKSCEALGDEVASAAKEIGFYTDTELYADTHKPKLTTEELLNVHKDPEILKRKRQNLLKELRSPEILRLLGLENPIPRSKSKQLKQKGVNQNERKHKQKR